MLYIKKFKAKITIWLLKINEIFIKICYYQSIKNIKKINLCNKYFNKL